MNLPGTTRVAVLVGRARDAGVTGAAGFADWLIIDQEWFGPCADMDAFTYRRWKLRAEQMYVGPPDAVVSNNSRLASLKRAERPRSRRRAAVPAPPTTAVKVVRRSLYLLAILLVVAVAGVSRAATFDPPTQTPSSPEDPGSTCTFTPTTPCAGLDLQGRLPIR